MMHSVAACESIVWRGIQGGAAIDAALHDTQRRLRSRCGCSALHSGSAVWARAALWCLGGERALCGTLQGSVSGRLG